MRISDWSSDVCSSDLVEHLGGFVGEGLSQPVVNGGMLVAMGGYMLVVEPLVALISMAFVLPQIVLMPLLQGRINRLIERRVVLLRRFGDRSEEHTSELQSLMRNSYAVFCLQKHNNHNH